MNLCADKNKNVYVLTVAETAEVLRIGKNAVYKLIRSGNLRSVRVGRKIIIPKVEILLFLGQKKCYNNTNTRSSSLTDSYKEGVI